MDFNEYQTLARRTQNQQLSLVAKEKHALFGMASEVGEIHGLHQKVYQGHALNIADAIKELGDLLWFAAEYADTLNITLDEVAQINIEKLRKRYPDGFDAEHSVHREEYGG
jgi:NTP pyrophosphatase (non-canonical NTP hydrolase)